MAGKQNSLLQHAKVRFEDARRQLGFAAMDFSIPDDRFLEMRAETRQMQDEIRKLERKSKSLFSLFGF
ncbi:hypothetical protein WOC76_13905 [Methylocystis sp. IM3]|jgi:hypothetical protein|uniref:hypothetical protein n=1 Tax=unclassified Methylocystis TaxID=2625913 RepID=UPI0026C94409